MRKFMRVAGRVVIATVRFFRPGPPLTSAEFAQEAELQRMRSSFTGG
ncbi:hypothetical protein FB464_0018 [Subtercola boreus]|nr:hypothetical protein FB464_0018 [Subtercola boreus]